MLFNKKNQVPIKKITLVTNILISLQWVIQRKDIVLSVLRQKINKHEIHQPQNFGFQC